MERVEPRSPGPGGAEEDGAAPHPPRPPWLSAPWLIDTLLGSIALPLALALGGAVRTSMVSGAYLLACALLLACAEHSLSTVRQRVCSWIVRVVCLVSGFAVLGHAVFLSMWLEEGDGEDGWLRQYGWVEELLHYAGWQRVDYVKDHIILNNIRQIAPDPIVFLLSLTVLLRAWTRRPTTQPTEELVWPLHYYCYPTFLVAAVVGLSVPSVLGLPYLFFYVLGLLGLAYSASLPRLFQALWPALLLLSMSHLGIIYAYQFRYIRDHTPTHLTNLLGLYHWEQLTNWSDLGTSLWQAVVGLAALIVLYFWVCRYSRARSLYKARKQMQHLASGEEVPAPQPSITASTSMLAVFSRRGRGRGRGAEKEHTTRIVAKWLAQHGWRGLLAAMLFVSVANVNLFSLVILVLAMAGALLPPRYVVFGTLPTLLYVIAVSSAQYVWNIPFDFPQARSLSGMGLVEYELPFVRIGLQWALALGLAVYWRLFTLYRKWAMVGVMKKQAYYSWFVGRPGPGGLLQHLPSVEETAALLAAESGSEPNYGASSSAPSRKESRVPRFADDVVGHGGDEEQNERAHRHTGLTDDDDDDYNREPPMHGRGNGAESASFMDEPADGRKHLRDKAAEFWHVVKLVTATVKQSMLALLNLVWQILLHESHKFALCGLWICSLMEVSVFNGGYMAIFIVFVLWQKLATRFWVLLVLYCQAVLLALYVWQLPWLPEDSSLTSLIGFQHFPNVWAGFGWHMAILGFSVAQNELNKVSTRGFLFKKPTPDQLRKYGDGTLRGLRTHLNRHVYTLIVFGYTMVVRYFLSFSYLGILLLALLTPANMINVLYVTFIFACIIVHFQTKAPGRVYVRRMWPFLVFFAGGALACRYLYQFDDLAEIIDDVYPDDFLPLGLKDLGFEQYPTKLFVALLPNAIVLVLSVFQLRMFNGEHWTKTLGSLIGEENEREEGVKVLAWWEGLVAGVRRLVMLHGRSAAVWVLAIIGCTFVTVIRSGFLVLAVVSLIFIKWGARCRSDSLSWTATVYHVVTFVSLIYSQAVVLAQLVFFFPSFDDVSGGNPSWFGFDRAHEDGQIGGVISGLSAMVVVLIARYGQSWLAQWYSVAALSHNDEESGEDMSELTLFPVDKETVQHGRRLRFAVVWNYAKWYASHAFALHGQHLFGFMLLVVAFVRNDAVSWFYLVLLAASMVFPFSTLVVALPVFVTVQASIIFAQYASLLGFPPFMDIVWPPDLLAEEVTTWLGLDRPYPEMLLLDFMLLWLAVLLLYVPSHIHPFPEAHPPLRYDFTLKPRSWNDELKFQVLQYSSRGILVVVMVVGLVHTDLLSAGYLIFSLALLYHGGTLLLKQNAWWWWLRAYNLLVLAALAFYSLPWLPQDDDPQGYAKVIGFEKMEVGELSAWSDLVIFCLLSVQGYIFDLDDMNLVVDYLLIREGWERVRAQAEDEVRQEELQKALDLLRKEQTARKTRLAHLKQTRLRSQLTSALQSEGASPIDSQAPSPRPESPRGPRSGASPRKGKEKEFEESGGGDGKLAPQATAARRPTRPSPKKKAAAPQENLWKKIKGWYAAAKRMLVPLFREYSAAAMERTVVLLEWLAEKHLEKDVHAKLKERGLDETILFANDYRHHLRRQDSAAAGAEGEEASDSDDSSSSSAADDGSSSEDESSTSSASSSCDSSDSECASEDEAVPPTSTSASQTETEISAQSEELLAGAAKAGVTFDSSADAAEDFPDDDDTSAVVHNSARWWRQQLGRAYNSWVKWVSTNTNIICYLALVVNHAAYASVLSVVYPVSLFIYAALAAPRPTKTYWRLVLAYSSVVVCVKFLFQLSFLCVCYTASGEEYAVQPTCELETCRFEQTYDTQLGLTYVIGIYKVTGFFLKGSLWDVVLILAVLWHRHQMKMKGYWDLAVDLKQEFKGLQKSRKQWMGWLSLERQTHAHHRLPTLPPHLLGSSSMLPITGIRGSRILSSRHSTLLLPVDLKHTLPPDAPQGGVHIQEWKEALREGATWAVDKAKGAWNGVMLYYRCLFSKFSPNKDFYTSMLFIQFLSFLYLILFQQDFTGVETSSLLDIFMQSRIPSKYVWLLVGQFLLIIVERIIYLLKSTRAKLVLHYALVVLYHWGLCFQLPSSNGRSFASSPLLLMFYLLQCLYLYLSSLQLRFGYPLFAANRALTNSKDPSKIRYWLFMAYRAIPFGYELSTILNWTIHRTALDFFEWLKVEDLYADLFEIKCRNADRERSGRKPGDAQPLWIKLLIGMGLFFILCLVIWFPLLLLASDTPGNSVNQVHQSTITVGIEGWEPFYRSYQATNVSFATNAQFARLRGLFPFILNDEQPTTQLISFQPYSEVYWWITAESLETLLFSLQSDHRVELSFTYSFTRDQPASSPTTSGRVVRALTPELKAQLYSMLATNATGSWNVTIPKAFPRAYRLPLSEAVSIPSPNQYVGLQLTLYRKLLTQKVQTPTGEMEVDSLVLAWRARQVQPSSNLHAMATRPDVSSSETDEPLFSEEGPQVVSLSTMVPTDSLTRKVMATGIIGLYITVVLSVGRFLRMSLSRLVPKIRYEDLPNVEFIISLCEDLFIARQFDNLLLEEELYWELIELYRDPSLILEVTGRRPVLFKHTKHD